MYSQNSFRFLLVIPVMLFSTLSCVEKKEVPENPLIGDWTKVIQGRICTVTFTFDHKWQVEFADDAGIDVWGSYIVSGDQITIIDEGGPYTSEESGVYRFQATSSSLTLTVVSDEVEGRRTVIEGVWTRVQ
jgi:hypothetical protein